MKRITVFSLSMLTALSLVFTPGCTNLEETVYSNFTTDVFPQSEEEIISALGVTYTSLYFFMSHNGLMALNEIASDEAMIPQRGSDWFDGGQWIRVHRHEMNAAEEAVNNGWSSCYSGVSNCNRVIELLEGLVQDDKVSAADAAAFIGEVKVLRALFYFWLMDTYGNVPIVTNFANAVATPSTADRKDVFAFIENELNENVPNLSRAKDGTTYARFNYWAGKALQTKLYLNAQVYTGQAKWAEAVAAADEIINSNLYSLQENYFDNFDATNDDSKENIFVIPYDRSNALGFNLSQMTLHYSSQSTFDLAQQPWNGYCTLQEFYNSYEENDIRRDGTPGRGYGNFLVGPQFDANGNRLIDSGAEPEDPDGQPLTFTPEINEHFPNALRQAGARFGKYEYVQGGTPEMDNDYPIFRYSDILMAKAEALWRQNPGDATALALVNQIRERAGVDPFTELNADNLLAERGREFVFEYWRRQDLIRFDRFGGEWDFKPVSGPEKIIMPIPAPQLQANPNLSQNPGY